MRLDDWLRLSAEERQVHLGEWGEDSNKWWPIAHEAVERFQQEFGSHPQVLCIGTAHTMRPNGEPRIYIDVRTRLPQGQCLAEVPSEYLTFPVVQDGLAEAVDAFKKTWAAILSRILDWDEKRISQFIDEQEAVFHSDFFLHDSPLYLMPQPIFTDSLIGKRDGIESYRIGEEMIRAIIDDGRYTDHFDLLDDPDFDWAAARKRAEAVAAKYR